MSSGVEPLASKEKVKTAFLRSNPYDTTSPKVVMGLGRTNASAARNPAQPRSPEVLLESIDGVLRVVFRFAGCTGEEVADRLWEKEGELWSSDIEETFLELEFSPS